MNTRKQNHTSDSLKAYEIRQAEIRRLVRRIEDKLESHDKNASGKPGGHNWADVGDLDFAIARLTEVSEFLKTHTNK